MLSPILRARRLIANNHVGAAGVVLVQSLQLSGFFQYGVRLAADTENYFTSVERIQVIAEHHCTIQKSEMPMS